MCVCSGVPCPCARVCVCVFEHLTTRSQQLVLAPVAVRCCAGVQFEHLTTRSQQLVLAPIAVKCRAGVQFENLTTRSQQLVLRQLQSGADELHKVQDEHDVAQAMSTC